jgi:hypothetical protein
MTRRLRPPAPLRAECHGDGSPHYLYRGGRRRAVTHIAATWVRPAPWWANEAEGEEGSALYATRALNEERTYYRVVLDGILVYEIFRTCSGSWYLERIID